MIGHGGELYLENCAACHSTTGVGGSMTQGRFPGPVRRETSAVAPGLASATPVEIAEAIRTGPGAMPVFGKGVLNDSDVDAIVTYVRYIQRPSDRGGSSIGRIGPVAEGAVGWIVGLGLLLVLSRWIGTRAET
jgi:ubiquinol-cytochrome c reductase cytochrome c subunit